MSQVKTLAVSSGTVTRRFDDNTGIYGAGQNRRLYTGRSGTSGRRNFRSYLKFTMNWTGVGSIVSAVLSLYTDDGLGGTIPFPKTTDSPTVIVRALTAAFVEGNNADEHFDSTDATNPATTSTNQVSKAMSKVANGVTDIDITAMFKTWAPSTVVGGGRLTHYGIMLYGSTSEVNNWSGWSEDATNPAVRPVITLTYELAATDPNVPGNLTPDGAVAAVAAFEGDFTDDKSGDVLARTQVQVITASGEKSGTAATTDIITVASHGYANGQEVWFTSLTGGTGLKTTQAYYVRDKTTSTFKVASAPGGAAVDISVAYSALKVIQPIYFFDKTASDTETLNAHSFVVPEDMHLTADTNYKWRMRQRDQEAHWSPWTALVTFSVTNTPPNAPTPSPAAGTFDSLTGVLFRGGTFSDADAGDTLAAYQVQMSLYPEGDSHWSDPTFWLWDTGKVYVKTDSTDWETAYGGRDLAADTYYVRMRQWDNHDGVSDWAYTSLVLTADFDADPGSQTSIQIDPHAPWRVRIRAMKFDTVAAVTGNAGTDLITAASTHGLAAGRRVRFTGLVGGAGLLVGTDYYVIASGLTTTAFKVSATLGGSAVNFTTNITSGSVTAIVKRGPGDIVAILENQKGLGGSIMYNSPGEAHFTLPVDHPQLAVIEPKQVHYAIDFYSGDGWRETFAGLVDDYDATDTEVVFPCVDYLGLLQRVMDERYYPAEPDRTFDKGGSKYVDQTIGTVIHDQLLQVTTRMPNSPVGFIQIGDLANYVSEASPGLLAEKVTLWTTMTPTLGLISSLLDSHRQGTGKMTRIEVKRTTGGNYQFVVTDDPGIVRDNLRLQYGELIQGYRVIPFGADWASVLSGIGRTRDGLRVMYKTKSAPGLDPTIWGRFARAVIIDSVSDEHDLERRVLQAAIHAGKLGKGLGLGIREGVLRPRSGYDVTDVFPVAIIHGAVDTTRFGSGYWVCYGITWEAGDDGSSAPVLTLMPRDDATSPSSDLIPSQPISPQPEWQIGWTPPDPLKATSKYWVDQNTGQVYYRDDASNSLLPITGTA